MAAFSMYDTESLMRDITMLLPVIIVGVILIVSLLLAYEFRDVARAKGYRSSKYFWFCFLLGIPGYLLVIALPDRFGRTKS